MLLHRLSLTDFRNIERAEIEPGPRATVIAGPNGQGKTNLLEAVYFLVTLKPLRASRLTELVRFGSSRARVEGHFTLAGAGRDIAVEISDGIRSASVGGKQVRELDEYFGGVSVVAFTPDDLGIVKGDPEGRRRFLDRAVWGRFPGYLAEHRVYGRALKARNRLLREGAQDAHVAAFDGPLAAAGARLIVRRRAYLTELSGHFTAALAGVTGGALEGKLRYAPPLAQGEQDERRLAELLALELEARLSRDRERGFTSIGPHTDALGISLDGRPARAYASQGQQRALVLALKIAEIETLRAAHGKSPLLLLDDVSSELDRERNAHLMEYLRGLDGQVLLTTTEPALVAAAAGADACHYRVREGRFEPSSEPG